MALIQPVRAQPVPAEISEPEKREVLELARKLSHTSFSYRTVATQLMLGEANYFSEELALPVQHPLQLSEISVRVSPPWYCKLESTDAGLSRIDRIRAANFAASGSIESRDFRFFFNGAGKLWSVNRVRAEGKDSILALYPELARSSSLIDTKGAYGLATQWLSSVSVDVPGLEQKYKPDIRQWFFWGKAKNLPKDQWAMPSVTATNKTMLPIFDVYWGQAGAPAAKVTVLGTTKELLELQVQDSSFSRRAPLIITNGIALNEIPNPPLKHLQQIQHGSETNSVGINPRAGTNRPPPFYQRVGNQ
jgi:hypothetical protein